MPKVGSIVADPTSNLLLLNELMHDRKCFGVVQTMIPVGYYCTGAVIFMS